MSNIQLMTGYGILISGFATLKDGLAAYHWLILVYVAWFSSLTHLASLTFLRRYILEQKFNRLWRLLAIWLLVVILCAALAPTAYFYWDPAYEHAENGMAGNITKPENYQAQPGSYAFCYFHHTYKVDRDMRAATVISILVLISSLFVRIVVLSEKASKLSHENAVKVRDAYSKRLRKWTSPRMLRHLEATYALPLQGTIRGSSNSWAEFVRYMFDGLVCAPLWAIYLVISLTVDFYSSMLWEVSSGSSQWFYTCADCYLLGPVVDIHCRMGLYTSVQCPESWEPGRQYLDLRPDPSPDTLNVATYVHPRGLFPWWVLSASIVSSTLLMASRYQR